MQLILILAISLHVLAGIFWAGSTFTLARVGGAGADRLFGPQVGAAVATILAGGYLWHLLHSGGFGRAELVLAVGAVAALVALAVQIAVVGPALRRQRTAVLGGEATALGRFAIGHRIAALLLAVTAVCMVAARYF